MSSSDPVQIVALGTALLHPSRRNVDIYGGGREVDGSKRDRLNPGLMRKRRTGDYADKHKRQNEYH